MICEVCGKPLTVWDEGFYKKTVNRGATPRRCVGCTCAHFEIPLATAREMIRRFQQTGCTLFPADEEPPDFLA
ncbi:MAG: hypothetical protein ACOYJY_04315 [Acutalibacteraceae bacterium]|jgi:hypothetical protein